MVEKREHMKTIRTVTFLGLLNRLFENGAISIGTYDALVRLYNENGSAYVVDTLRWYCSIKVYREMRGIDYLYCIDVPIEDAANDDLSSPPEGFSNNKCNSIW